MVELRRWKEEIIMKAGALLAVGGLLAASFAANGACMFPFFEPEQPEELENLRRFAHPKENEQDAIVKQTL